MARSEAAPSTWISFTIWSSICPTITRYQARNLRDAVKAPVVFRSRSTRLSERGGPMLFRFGNMLSLLFDGSTVQSGMKVSDPDHLLFDYARMMMAFRLFRSRPGRIEMIGLGGGSVAKACYRTLPDCDITVVEIDPKVIALRGQFHVPPDDCRFRVVCADGVDYVANDAGKPDVLLLDGFDNRGLPHALSNRAFYDSCSARLGSKGFLVANLCGNNATFAVLQRHIAASFDGQAIGVAGEQRGNRIVFASADPAFPPSPESFQHAVRQGIACDVIDYAVKACRIEPALRRWMRHTVTNFPRR